MRPGASRCRSVAISTKFSRPVRILVNGGELPGEADRLADVAGLGDDVEAVHWAVPPSALSSVERILMTVVLPAPLEPSRAKMLPGATSKSTPRSTLRSPYDFQEPGYPDGWCLAHKTILKG